MRASAGGLHISGAEGLYREQEIARVVGEYLQRALSHSRGKPGDIVLTVEKVEARPGRALLLPVTTLECGNPGEARSIISGMLSELGVSKRAAANAFRMLKAGKTMRGASLVLVKSGCRVEPDKARGVRVSRLGIEKDAAKRLGRKLSKLSINTSTVREALILASKVASHPDVVAELCISDDPDYTTGYIASGGAGYLRLPNIKQRGELHGGRVFFIRESADIGELIHYLERTPVLVGDRCGK